MKSIQQQADEVVEKFKDIKILTSTEHLDSGDKVKTYTMGTGKASTQCAIIHVDGILEELEYFDNLHSGERKNELKDILSELKSRI